MVYIDTPLLDEVRIPSDLRNLSEDKLPQLARELRSEMIDVVSVTGGHLGAGLGVVELTIALHYVFNTPIDRLIWDVGHQSYPHKILTGRRHLIRTIRQEGGISGFTNRKESEYDPFGAGHSSTSISAGLGIEVASNLKRENYNVISVIGDGAISAGIAYEALNNARDLKSNIIVILNDNEMSISNSTGAISKHLSRLVSSRSFEQKLKTQNKFIINNDMEFFLGSKKNIFSSGNFFENLGFCYIGPIDGHNFNHLIPTLKNVLNSRKFPFLIHIITKKGKGYLPAETSIDKYHGVNSFNIRTGKQLKKKKNGFSFTEVFSKSLVEEARHDDKIIAITAAMSSGTGLDYFKRHFPNRMFDTGIAEQHAVTFAAGLASEGMKPFTAIYSTFLQRSHDQIIHDVSIQKLSVRFAIDRAGFVGSDGATHSGSFDISFLTSLPDFVVMAPSDNLELMHMVRTAADYDDGPISFRYPKGESEIDIKLPIRGDVIPIGKGRVLREGNNIVFISFGSRLHETLAAADELLTKENLSSTVVDARFARPIDENLIIQMACEHEILITVEEGSLNGFGSIVLQFLSNHGLLDRGLKVRTMTLPDRYLKHGSQKQILKKVGLDRNGIIKTVFSILNH